MVENLPFAQHVVEPCTSLNEDGIGNAWESANIKFTKKVSGSACDLMDHTGTSSYNIIFGQVGNPRKSQLYRLGNVSYADSLHYKYQSEQSQKTVSDTGGTSNQKV